jgi:hypothetical protein
MCASSNSAPANPTFSATVTHISLSNPVFLHLLGLYGFLFSPLVGLFFKNYFSNGDLYIFICGGRWG